MSYLFFDVVVCLVRKLHGLGLGTRHNETDEVERSPTTDYSDQIGECLIKIVTKSWGIFLRRCDETKNKAEKLSVLLLAGAAPTTSQNINNAH